MMCKNLVRLLVAALVLNPVFAQSQPSNEFVIPAEIKQRYPDAEFRIMTVQEYEALRVSGALSNAAPHFPAYLAQSQQQSDESQTPVDSTNCESGCEDESKAQENGEGGSGGKFPVDLVSGLGSTPEGAVIILVVAGVVLVGALVFYAGVYLYELASGKFEAPSWWEVRAGLDTVIEDKLYGVLSSVRLKTGIPKSFLGLSLETGYYHLFVTRSDDMEEDYEGAYWLAGPFIEMHDSEFTYGSFEFLAGKSLHSKIGVMSKLKLVFNIKVSKNAVIGINLGGLYTDLEYSSGLFDSMDEFSWLIGVDAGVRF